MEKLVRGSLPVFIFLIFQSSGYTQNNFFISYKNDIVAVRDISNTSDGNQLIVAYDSTLSVVKIDPMGNAIWWNRYELQTNSAHAVAVFELSDSGVVAISLNYSQNNTDVVKYDQAGNLLWAKRYFLGILSGIATYDGGFVLMSNAGKILKCDGVGNIVWQTIQLNMGPSEIIETTNHDLVICGNIADSTGTDGGILRLDQDGNLIWAKKFGTPLEEFVQSLTENPDQTLTVCGAIKGFDSTAYYQIFLMHLDLNGDEIWSRMYLTNTEAVSYDVKTFANGDMVLAGGFVAWTLNSNAFCLKTDSTGNIIYSKTSTFFNWDAVQCVSIAADQSLYFGMSVFMAIAKLDLMGNGFCTGNSLNMSDTSFYMSVIDIPTVHYPFTVGISNLSPLFRAPGIPNIYCANLTGINGQVIPENNFQLYPVPFRDQLNIESKQNGNLKCVLYDINSKEILSQQFSGTIQINTQKLSKGIYFYKILNGDFIEATGMVVKN